MMKAKTVSAIFLMFFFYSNAQDINKIKLDGWMCCSLHSIFKKISEQHDVTFQYDIEQFKKMRYDAQTFSKPLDTFLEQVCKDNKLKYYINAKDSAIHIVDRWYTPNQTIVKNTQKSTEKPSRYGFSVSGKIIDKDTREALPFVSIMVKGTSIGSTSNVDGYYTLLNVPTDTSTLQLSYLGYEKQDIFLRPDVKSNDLLIELKPQVSSLDEVVVKAERQDILQISGKQTSMIKMSPKKLSSLPNLGEKDILRSFQLMPGISAANENSSGLYVRGGTPDQVLVLYDGFTVYNVEHMFGFFSAFNSNAIKDVQLYKGGFDAKYGGRLSSVLEITGKEGNQKELNAAMDLSLMSVNGFVEFPLGDKVSMIIAGRRSWKSPIYTKIFEQYTDENEAPLGRMGRAGGATEQETSSYFYDINAKITYRPSKKDVISLSFYNGKDDLDNSLVPSSSGSSKFGGNFNMNMETIDLTEWGNTGTSLKWSRKINNRLYLNSLISYSNYFSNRERGTSGSFTRGGTTSAISRNMNEDNNLVDFSGKIGLEYQLSEYQNIGIGFQGTHNDIDYRYIQNDTVSVIDRQSDGQTYALYLEDKISLFKSKLSITPGLRYTYFTGTSESYFEPRINLMYKLSDRISLKGAAGQYYQFAKRVIREDISEGSRDFWVLSDNDKLPVSSSLQFIGGLAYELDKYLFDIEGFYKKLDNVTEYSLRVEPSRQGIDYDENFFTGTGQVKGIDFLAQKKHGKMTGWIGYTLAQVTSNVPEFGNYDFYASNDVTHEFKTVLTYKWRKWDFGATWIYATGKPYTAPEGGYELTLLDGSTADYINVSVKNGHRLPDYHRLDLSATYNFKLGQKSPASIGFSVFNVYNRANVWYNEYEIIENEVIETPVYFLGITPNITLSVKLK